MNCLSPTIMFRSGLQRFSSSTPPIVPKLMDCGSSYQGRQSYLPLNDTLTFLELKASTVEAIDAHLRRNRSNVNAQDAAVLAQNAHTSTLEEAMRTYQSQRNFVAPVYCLPPEVLSYIFNVLFAEKMGSKHLGQSWIHIATASRYWRTHDEAVPCFTLGVDAPSHPMSGFLEDFPDVLTALGFCRYPSPMPH